MTRKKIVKQQGRHVIWTRSTSSAMRLALAMPKHTLTGNIKRHRAFPSTILGNRRDVLVYLPPGYRGFSRKRYPVLYLHDGQNVFDAATAFAGAEWGVDETAERLIRTDEAQPGSGPCLWPVSHRRIEALH